VPLSHILPPGSAEELVERHGAEMKRLDIGWLTGGRFTVEVDLRFRDGRYNIWAMRFSLIQPLQCALGAEGKGNKFLGSLPSPAARVWC